MRHFRSYLEIKRDIEAGRRVSTDEQMMVYEWESDFSCPLCGTRGVTVNKESSMAHVEVCPDLRRPKEI